jgi:hypothetical protein
MADAAEEQAGILAKELHPVPPFAPSLRSRLTVFLVSIFGPRAMRPVLSASKGTEGSTAAPATPMTRQVLETSPSLTPNTPAPSVPPPNDLWRRPTSSAEVGHGWPSGSSLPR